MRYRPSLDRVRYRPSLDRVRYRPSLDHVSSCPGPCRRPHVSAAFTVGRAEGPSSAMPRPNSACRRRRQPLCCEHIFACTPWRFMNARSAARLRRGVGPLASPYSSRRTGATDPHRGVSERGNTGDPHRRCRAGPDAFERPSCQVPVVPGADERPSCPVPVVPEASPVHGRVPVMARCAAESRAGRVPITARRLPIPGPTWPVADAANRCFETSILLRCRGVLSWPVRRRG